jgi:methionyl-tRNA synthetase
VAKHILVCAAWPYANAVMHLGHPAGYLLPADIFARYHRMAGNHVLFVSGSDEHGTPIMLQAERLGVPPAEVSERFHRANRALMEDYQISFDLFSRTTAQDHKRVVAEVFKELIDKGHIHRATMQGMYCPKEKVFRADRYVEGTCPNCSAPDARGDQCDACGKILDAADLVDPRCKLCGSPLEMRDTEHFFFALSKFQEPLLAWLATRKGWRHTVLNQTTQFVQAGLKDRAVTRDIPWGIDFPLPGYEGKKIYVWFEALLGYLSASRKWAADAGEPDAWRRWWQDEAAESYFFLGKDNIPFHTVILPAVLLGLGGYNLPTNVPANEYLLFEGAKFSKSKGVGMSMQEYLEVGEVAAMRYYLTVNMPELKDTEADWDDFVAKNNAELLGNLGNFVNRTLTLAHRHFGAVPTPPERAPPGALDAELGMRIDAASRRVAELLEACSFKAALKEVMALAQFGNQYIDGTAPWALAKSDPGRNARVLFEGVRLARSLAVMLAPFVPDKAQDIWRSCGEAGDVTKVRWLEARGLPVPRTPLPEPSPIIRPVDPASFVPGASREGPAAAAHPLAKLDLRVARIASVVAHPKADKLLLLQVDLGDETRQIVAGLRKEYATEELAGKTCVIVANLEPAKLRGEVSQGMLLAAEGGGVVGVLLATGAAPGATLHGCTRGAAPITFEEFQKVTFETAVDGTGAVGVVVKGEGGTEPLTVAQTAVRVDRQVPPGAHVR